MVDDLCECMAANCCCCVTEAYDVMTCNYSPSSYCVMTVFLIGTLSWNIGLVSHYHASDQWSNPLAALDVYAPHFSLPHY